MYLEGTSDLDQMITLQTALNEGINDDKNAIEYHSFPLLLLTGGGKLPSNFIRKVNSGLELDTGQDAKYLTWNNVLGASKAFKDDIRKQMTVVSGVSEISRGSSDAIGQVRSGAGLKILFQADINAIALKIPYFREAEIKLALSTLDMWTAETGESFGDDLYVEVDFPEDFVGLDELLKAQIRQIDIADGVSTIRDAIRSNLPNASSEDEIDQKVKEVIAEKQKLTAAVKPPQAQKTITPPKIQGDVTSNPPSTSEAKSMEQQQ
jgi:hypothetical protein